MNEFASTQDNGNVHAAYETTPLQDALKNKRLKLKSTLEEKAGVEDERLGINSPKDGQ